MATLRNKRKLAAITRETQEERPRNGQSRNTSVPRINEEYITHVSEEIEGRVTKKLSQEFSRTESHILGALSKLDEFLLNQQIRTHSETVPGTFRNTNVENQGTNEDDSQSDPHPEAGIFRGLTTQKSGPKDCRDMVTGGPEEIRHNPHTMTATQEEIPFLLPNYFIRPTEEGAFHKSTSIPQWGYPCDNWSRPDFVGPSTIGHELQFSRFSITISAEFRNFLNPSQRQCLRLMENQRNSNCLKIHSKRP